MTTAEAIQQVAVGLNNAGMFIGLGIAAAGWLIGRGLRTFKTDT